MAEETSTQSPIYILYLQEQNLISVHFTLPPWLGTRMLDVSASRGLPRAPHPALVKSVRGFPTLTYSPRPYDLRGWGGTCVPKAYNSRLDASESAGTIGH
jgi:hypothetical protein